MDIREIPSSNCNLILPLKLGSLRSKKRKIKAFLEHVSQDEECPKGVVKRQKTIATDREEKFTANSREYKKSEELPKIYLKDVGLQAQVRFTTNDSNENNPCNIKTESLCLKDIQDLLFTTLLPLPIDHKFPRWCQIVNSQNLKGVLFIILDGLSKDCVMKNSSLLKETTDIFDILEIDAPFLYPKNFVTELFTLTGETDQSLSYNAFNYNHNFNCLKDPMSSVPASNTEIVKNEFSKIHLILSAVQLAMENFPLPQSVFSMSSTKNYNMTKDIYAPISSKSQMFAIDCEMCRTRSGKMEVTHVAIVDENLKTVYNTLVKPKDKIIDYVTRYSGITEEMLKSVTTTLDDVQRKIKELLPPDAILCGQSLHYDLHALKMIHPYVIDTSVIYNISGYRTTKTSLRALSNKFLNESIQGSEKGHNPIEDCIATMKLILLKLKNGPCFGDIILSEANGIKETIPQSERTNCDTEKLFNEVVELTHNQHENMHKNSAKKHNIIDNAFYHTIFSKLLVEKKSTCIIGNEKSLDQYSVKMNSEVKKKIKSNKKAIKCTIKNLSNHNLIITHLQVQKSDVSHSLNEVNKWIGKLYSACSKNSLVLVYANAAKLEGSVYENGLCMLKIK